MTQTAEQANIMIILATEANRKPAVVMSLWLIPTTLFSKMTQTCRTFLTRTV